MRFRRIIFLAAVGVTLFTAPAVFGVGGGSGGSRPACSADTWSCSEWSTCSTAGQQARSCTLTFDCPTTETPKPAEQQSCAPPVTNSNTNADVEQSTTSINVNATSCTVDTWTCRDWSITCDSQGRQERTCALSLDCPSAATPSPEAFRPCDRLQCGQKESRRERILCRLNLGPEGLARELDIEFLPEACRIITDQAQRQECVQYYKDYQPCWARTAGSARISCARQVLKLGPIISEEVKTCRGQTGTDRVTCQAEIKDRVFDLVKFRFYDLEQRAEALGERGASTDAIANFVDLVEGKKIAFDQATTKAERRQIVLDVRSAWQAFMQSVRADIK